MIDRLLHDAVGSVASKLHTGRSRNDQVATATRLWTIDACARVDAALREAQHVLLARAEELTDADFDWADLVMTGGMLPQQVDTLQHTTTIYLHPSFPLLAKKLASKLPPGLDVTYFVNSGSEANDLAVTMARLHTGHSDVVALRNAYHGGSPSAMGLTSHNTWKFPVGGDGRVHHAVNPDP